MRPRSLGLLPLGLSTVALASLLSSAACSSSSSTSTGTGGGGGSISDTSAAVSGAKDAHCGTKVQPVSQAACTAPGTGGGGGGAGGTMEEPYTVMYNAEGDDDDCKYHVVWSSTAVKENQDVTFKVTLTTKSDGKPATGAVPDIEAFLSDVHPAPNSDQKPADMGNGVYTIGPMRFDAAGKWTVRFHFYETCSDLNEESPHAHAAFYFQVP